jgi:predicted ribonuclease YlaK
MRSSAGGGVIAVPDTNTLILAPDVAAYGSALGTDTYEVRLVPTVSAELDRLKVEGRTPELREKVQAVIRRIKGLRDRRSLSAGVAITHTVRFVSQATEPDFSRIPSWLDRTNNYDRILASAMAVQGSHAASTVVLVTSDLNLQTKADAAGLPYVEPPGQT